VFDEPSAGLDPIVAAELDELILLLKQVYPITVVVVTHELTSAFKIADRLAMLCDGAFVAVGTKDEIRNSENPHVKQFLDRIPGNVAKTTAITNFFERYLEAPEVNQ
jgi:phospholipid/cholesterol/gamma-HCH transport system ATP-binding protein